jgi:hypothetical protein
MIMVMMVVMVMVIMVVVIAVAAEAADSQHLWCYTLSSFQKPYEVVLVTIIAPI